MSSLFPFFSSLSFACAKFRLAGLADRLYRFGRKRIVLNAMFHPDDAVGTIKLERAVVKAATLLKSSGFMKTNAVQIQIRIVLTGRDGNTGVKIDESSFAAFFFEGLIKSGAIPFVTGISIQINAGFDTRAYACLSLNGAT